MSRPAWKLSWLVVTLVLAGACSAPRPWTVAPAPGDLPLDRPLRAGFLIVDGVYNSELIAPYDILQHTKFHTDPWIDVFTVSPDGAAVTTFEGLEIVPHHGFDDAPPIDILVVPSAEGSMTTDLDDATLLDWVREVGGRSRYVMSLCDGAFVLAAAGLLDGRAVTTFPGDLDAFAEAFPGLELHREVSFVHDGPALTSAGGAKSYDVAMYLVAHLYGEKVAQGVGRGLVLPWPPEAGSMPAAVVVP